MIAAGGRRVCRNLVGAGLSVLFTAASASAASDQAPLPRLRPAIQEPVPPALSSGEKLPAAKDVAGDQARLPKARPTAAERAELGSVADAESVPEGEEGRVGPATAGSQAPDVAPAPPPAVGASGPASAVAALELLARTPRARPDERPPAALALVAPALTEPAPEAPLAPAVLSGSDQACMERLGELDVSFTRMPPIDPGGACPVAAPLKVAGLGSGVSVTPEATMNCRTAEAVALWVRDVVVPKAKAHLGAVPTGILPGSTYACRPRNDQEGAKLSEHAQANAFDVMGIAFADRPAVEIAPRGASDPEGRFQADIRAASCAYFTTVLGPGSDASHADHLHFDMAERDGGYRLCSLGEPLIADAPEEKAKRE